MVHNKKTHEQYEQQLFEREIDYWPLERYVNSKTKILHECLNGHQWEVSPGSILAGYGCPHCYGNIKKTPEQYIHELKVKDIKYIPLEPYVNKYTPILHQCLKCPDDFSWKITPDNVLRGHGCPQCAGNRRKTTEQYKAELESKGIFYKALEEYINDSTPILHQCPCPNEYKWKTSPGSILSGKGCPKCADYGFQPDLPAILYYIKIDKFQESFYKIGITNKTVFERFQRDSDKDITILMEKRFAKGVDAAREEKEILTKYKHMRQSVPGFLKSRGNTELFEEDILGLDT